jgi:hypothetical protein
MIQAHISQMHKTVPLRVVESLSNGTVQRKMAVLWLLLPTRFVSRFHLDDLPGELSAQLTVFSSADIDRSQL